MTKLADLDATFVYTPGGSDFQEVATLAAANGVMFDCPKCGNHSVLLWDQSVPAGIEPGPGRWTMTGTCLDDLTLHPSINLTTSACKWHGWVTKGAAA